MLKRSIGKYLLFIVLYSLGICSYAQNDSLQHNIQSIVDSYLINSGKQERISGLAVTISYPKNQEMIQQSYFAGKTSHRSDAKPITANTLFDIGSITKSYTAAIILQLEAENLLNINDPIGKWLPQYPMWKDVTIKQLLNMTSGIPNYTSNPKFTDFHENNLTAEFDEKFLLSFAEPNKPIITGKKFEYSNSNYILASLIIEAITKQNFADALQTRLFDPLNLKHTYYAAGSKWKDVNKVTFPRKAHGYRYDYENNKLLELTNVNLSWGGAAGGIVSTTSDQIKWVDALFHGKIFPEKSKDKLLQELTSVVSLETGQPIKTVNKNDPYAFGLGVALGYENNQRFWLYEGSTLGFRMMYIWKPCNNITVIAALNSSGKGNLKSPIKDNIKDLILNIYKKIIEANPKLICSD